MSSETEVERADERPMHVDSTMARPTRLLRVTALLLLLGAAYAWLRPIDVPGRNFQPFGCGTAASPMPGQLAATVCGDAVSSMRWVALVLLAGATVLLAVGEAALPRFGRAAGVVAACTVLAVPLLAAAAHLLVAPIRAYGSDGTSVPCGSALAPSVNPLARGICASVPQTHLADGLALVGLAVLLAAGVVYLSSAPKLPTTASS